MYCVQADIEARLGLPELLQLTDRAGVGVVDTVAVEQAILDASTEIDTYLAARYALPLPSVPPVLVRVAAEIAIYQLFNARRMGATDDVRTRYTDVRALLEKLADGKLSLGLPAPPAPVSVIVMESAPAVWSRHPRQVDDE